MGNQQFFYELKPTFALRQQKDEKPTLIYMNVYYHKKCFTISTGVKVYPSQWNKEKHEAYISFRLPEIDNRNNTIVNDRIAKLKEDFLAYKEYICANPDKFNQGLSILKNYIYNGEMKELETKEPINVFAYLLNNLDADPNKKGDVLKSGTKKTDYDKLKHFKTFIDQNNIVFYSFEDITRDMLCNYQSWLIDNLKGRTGEKVGVKRINDIVTKLLELLKKYAVLKGKMSNSHFQNLLIEKLKDKSANIDNNIALRDDEIFKLWNYKPTTIKDEHIRDMFLLNCVVGQRIGDLGKIDNNIEQTATSTFITLIQDKGTKKVEVELIFTLAKQILEKYNYDLPSVENNSNNIFNKRLKVIAKEAGITGKETIVTHPAGGQPITEIKERYDCVTSHTARRTFVTLLSVRGWTYNTIAKYTGQTIEMVELYDKSKGNTKTLRMYKDLKATNPELVLRLIDDSETHESIKNNTRSRVKPTFDNISSIDKDKANYELFDKLFAKGFTEDAINTKYDIRVTDKDKQLHYLLGFIKAFATDDSLVEDAINNYTPDKVKLIKPCKTVGMSKELIAMKTKAMNFGNKPNDVLLLERLIKDWVDLGLEREYIDLYIKRAEKVGIDTSIIDIP